VAETSLDDCTNFGRPFVEVSCECRRFARIEHGYPWYSLLEKVKNVDMLTFTVRVRSRVL